MRDADPAVSLEIARQVSTAVIEVVRGAVGGRTRVGGGQGRDHLARCGGARPGHPARRQSLGQLLPGLVSVFRPVEALPEVVGTPYVVFAGNVGDETTLAYVVDLFSGRTVPR